MSNKRVVNRNYCLVLYAEDNTHMRALDFIRSSYDYALILHDKDVNENGELKKPHYHVIITFSNARSQTSVAKELGIEVNYLQVCRNRDSALLYLVHHGSSDKFQYSIDDVEGTLKSRLKQIYVKKCDDRLEGEKVLDLLDYIDNYDGYLDIRVFARYCAQNNNWDVFRRSGGIFIECIKSHNERFNKSVNK